MSSLRTLHAALSATVVLGASIAMSDTPAALSGIDGLKIWLDATDLAGGDTLVSSWVDKASGIAFTQGNGSLQPSLVDNAMNGLPVVRFSRPDSNSAQYLSGNDGVISTLFDNPNTAFVVARANAGCGDSGSQDPQYVFARVGNHSGLGFGGYPDATQYYSCRWHLSNAGILENRVNGYTQGDTVMMTRIVTGSTASGPSSLTLAVNNEVVATATTPNAINPQGGGLNLGCAFASGGYCGGFTGDIAEILLFDRVLTAEEQTAVWYYLGARWGMISLTLANPVTGSTEFTSSGNLSIVVMPPLDNGAAYQFSNSANSADLGAWSIYDAANPPKSVTLAPPATDGDWTIYLWTRANAAADPVSYPYTLTYTTVPPTVVAKDVSLTFDSVNGTSITPDMVDNGSFDAVSGIHSRNVSPAVLYGPGTVTLTVTNNAGLAASAVSTLSAYGFTDIYVSPDGNDANVGRQDSPVRTLTHAISALGGSGTIYIAPGTYSAATGETFPLRPDSAALVGQGGDPSNVVITAGDTVTLLDYDGSRDSLSSIAVRNLTLNGGNIGLHVADATNCASIVFRDLVVRSAATHGANLVNFTDGAVFSNCVFTANGGTGLWYHKSHGTVLDHCIFAANAGAGLTVGCVDPGWFNDDASTKNLTASYCCFSKNGANAIDLRVCTATGWTFNHCTFDSNVGIAFGDGYPIYYPHNCLFTRCLFTSQQNVAIRMDTTPFTLEECYFYNNADNITGGNAGNGVLTDCVLDGKDPCYCPGRNDGAIFDVSPIIGKCSDGSNYGCFQGSGVPVPVGNTYYVRPDGNDLNDGLSDTLAGAFATIAKAASVMGDAGETLHIAAGTYTAAAAFDGLAGASVAPVRIIAEEGAVLSVPNAQYALSFVDSANVILSGLTVADGGGMLVSGSASFLATNCVFAGCTGSGVENCDSPFGTYIDCVFSNNAAQGLWFYRSAGMTFLRDAFKGNGQCGIVGGAGGWGADNDVCTGTHGSCCYFAGNGMFGVGMNVNSASWAFDHCTFVENTLSGYGANEYVFPNGISPGSTPLTDCLFAFNKLHGLTMNWGTLYTTNSLYWSNDQGAFGGNGFQSADVCNLGGCILDKDPLLVAGNADGAVYAGSPVIGAASDGGNIGCYQGPGITVEVDAHAYFVRLDGDDANDGLADTSAQAFATVARGLAALAGPGDSLHVAEGVYNESATLADVAGLAVSPIVVDFAPGAVLVAREEAEAALVVSNVLNFAVNGLAIRDGVGLVIRDSSSGNFSNLTVTAATGVGAEVTGSSSVAFVDSSFVNCGIHGVWLNFTSGTAFTRCVFAGNTLCGFDAGEGASRVNTCPGVSASYCAFLGNGFAGAALSDQNLSGWTFTHCTFAGNRVFGIGEYLHGIWPAGVSSVDCLFVCNGGAGVYCSHGAMPTDYSLFWGNGHADITDCNEGLYSIPSDGAHNIYGRDPLLCDWHARRDGAVYVGSPALGAASDGQNLGCYQGAPVAFPATATYYVNAETGSDDSDGLASSRAFATLAKAFDRVFAPGDTIRVAAGAYDGPATFTAVGTSTRPVRLLADDGATITADGIGLRVVDSAFVEVSGLSFADCTTVGLSVEKSSNSAFSNGAATGNGVGIATDNASFDLVFTAWTIESNLGAGVSVTGSPDLLFDRCRIARNGGDGVYCASYDRLSCYAFQHSQGWLAWLEKGVELRQCLVVDNLGWGADSAYAGDIRLLNCMVASNNGGVHFDNNRHADGNALCNTIVSHNGGDGVYVAGVSSDPNYFFNTITYSCVYGNDGTELVNAELGEGCIDADPRLKDPANGNYRISAASPCVDAGTNLAWMVEATDFGGRTERIANIDKGGIVDIGPYEVKVGGTLIMVK